MYAPIYLPEADRISPAVLAAEAAIIARDGLHHVGDRYFASQADAATVRRTEAERIVRAELRQLARLGSCVFCTDEFLPGDDVIVMAGAPIHRQCAIESDTFAHGPTDAEIDELLDGLDSIEAAA